MIVLHAQGFASEGGVREVHVSVQEAESVIAVARGTFDALTDGHTRIVSFIRTWPIDAYGVDSAVRQVEGTTATTLDDGETWTEMWHWFGTPSGPWPLATSPSAVPTEEV